MVKNTLASARYPTLVQKFARENFDMKLLTAISLLFAIVCVSTTVVLIKRQPIVVALAENGKVAKTENRTTELQVQEAVRNYLMHRYSWNESSIAEELKRAESFVDPDLATSFRKSMAETIRYVREKHVTQRVYPREETLKIDFKSKSITLSADRFTEFDTLKAATEMKLTLWFDTGDKTFRNPWGVYIEREQEGSK